MVLRIMSGFAATICLMTAPTTLDAQRQVGLAHHLRTQRFDRVAHDGVGGVRERRSRSRPGRSAVCPRSCTPTRPRGGSAGWAPRRCRSPPATARFPRTGPDRRADGCAPRTAAPRCVRLAEVQQPNTVTTCSSSINRSASRAKVGGVGATVGDHRLDRPAEDAAGLVHLLDREHHCVDHRRFAVGHGAGQRVQHPDAHRWTRRRRPAPATARCRAPRPDRSRARRRR